MIRFDRESRTTMFKSTHPYMTVWVLVMPLVSLDKPPTTDVKPGCTYITTTWTGMPVSHCSHL